MGAADVAISAGLARSKGGREMDAHGAHFQAREVACMASRETPAFVLLYYGRRFLPSAEGSDSPVSCASVGAISRISITPRSFVAGTPGPTRKKDARS